MNTTTVRWRDMMDSDEYKADQFTLNVPLGVSGNGDYCYANLHALRSLLIAGAANSGKTNYVQVILNSLIATHGPDTLRLLLIDPKSTEYLGFNDTAYLLTPVITDAKKAILALKWIRKEADRRLVVLSQERVRTIEEYHAKVISNASTSREEEVPEKMPYVVVVFDEISILMAQYPRELHAGLAAILGIGDRVGIHLIVTTTRPDAQMIPAVLRDQFLARIALHMPGVQSRMMVGESGTEKFTEPGMALFRPNSMSSVIQIQIPRISDAEIDENVATIAEKHPQGSVLSSVDFSDDSSGSGRDPHSIFDTMAEDVDDDKFQEAVEAVREAGRASTSYLQRKMGIGYSRAARLIDLLEEQGILGPGDGAKPREVL